MDRHEIIKYLEGFDDGELFERARTVRNEQIGSKVYLRGLIELSNRCTKNCYYCGIRCGNTKPERYELTKEEVITAAKYAYENNYGSVVLQAGERQSESFASLVCDLIEEIKKLSNNQLGITLSLGEQSAEVYRRWFNSGAHRYLLRIEESNAELYAKLHPADHSFDQRLSCLQTLRDTGFQVGTGVMIGLPGQTIEHLADNLLFLRESDIDMCGMGPYIEHPDAPLGASEYTLNKRLGLGLRMIALLRLLMPKINIASTTALHALHPHGREMGIEAGANVIMPNITPPQMRGNYKLYNNKPLNDIDLSGFDIAYGEWGDSHHFTNRNNTR